MAQVHRLKPLPRARPPGIRIFSKSLWVPRAVADLGRDAMRIARALKSQDDEVVRAMALQLAPLVPDIGPVVDCEERLLTPAEAAVLR